MAHPRFWEVEGLCSDGEWRGVYQAAHQDEGRRYLIIALNTDDELHARWEDFRLVPPTNPKHKKAPLPTTVVPTIGRRRVQRGKAKRRSA